MTPTDLTTEVLDLCRELPLVRRLGLDDPERLIWVDRRRRAVQQLDARYR